MEIEISELIKVSQNMCRIQKNLCTVTVAPTIEHHGGHSRTPVLILVNMQDLFLDLVDLATLFFCIPCLLWICLWCSSFLTKNCLWRLYPAASTICPGLLLISIFYSEGNATFHYTFYERIIHVSYHFKTSVSGIINFRYTIIFLKFITPCSGLYAISANYNWQFISIAKS